MMEYTLGDITLPVRDKVAVMLYGDIFRIHTGIVLVDDHGSEYTVCNIGVGTRAQKRKDDETDFLCVLLNKEPVGRTLYLKEDGQ